MTASKSNPIAWFADIGMADRPTVGGKGGSLGELTQAGIDVPAGFVVTTAAFEEFLASLETRAPIRARVGGLAGAELEEVRQVAEELQARMLSEPLPAAVEHAIRQAYDTLCATAELPVAVRSSATTEDSEDASFAGLQDTFLWILNAEEVVRRIRECWASLYCVESITYRLRHELPESGVAMGVVVQHMVNARTAGVMFTRSPTTGDKSVITIEGAWGLGAAVVSGEVTPDRWVLGKITGDITVREVSDKHIQQIPAPGGGVVDEDLPPDKRIAPCLSDEELQALREVGRRIERHYGRAQDIEWAIDHHGKILLLQSRPETVWSTAKTGPIATAQADPRQHILGIFGRRT